MRIGKETIEDHIAVLQAYNDNKIIQCRPKGSEKPWSESYHLYVHDFDFMRFDYRIKPEPREIWVNCYKDQFGKTKYIHNIYRQDCDINRADGAEMVHFREVIE